MLLPPALVVAASLFQGNFGLGMKNVKPLAGEACQTENSLRQAVVRQKIEYNREDGCIPVPAGAGLGIEAVREAVDEFRKELVTIC